MADTLDKVDLDWMKRMDTHVRAARNQVQLLEKEHPVIQGEFRSLNAVLLNAQEELDFAFQVLDPESQPEPEHYADPKRKKVGQN